MKIAYKLRAFAITGVGHYTMRLSFYKPPLFSGDYKMTDPCISSGENMGGGVSIKKIYLYIFLLHVGVIKSWFLLNLSCIDSSCHLITFGEHCLIK